MDGFGINDLATDAFIPVVGVTPFSLPQCIERPLQMYDDTVLMGDLAFSYLASEANVSPSQVYSD